MVGTPPPSFSDKKGRGGIIGGNLKNILSNSFLCDLSLSFWCVSVRVSGGGGGEGSIYTISISILCISWEEDEEEYFYLQKIFKARSRKILIITISL